MTIKLSPRIRKLIYRCAETAGSTFFGALIFSSTLDWAAVCSAASTALRAVFGVVAFRFGDPEEPSIK